MSERLYIFDTTLRDGGQIPGCRLSTTEKIEAPRLFEPLGVDVSEAGFPGSAPDAFNPAPGIFERVSAPAPSALTRCALTRCDPVDTPVRILNYSLSLAQGMHPVATLRIGIHGREYERTSAGDGQYDAFMRALRQIYREQLGRAFPMLRDYTVSIPPGGRTDAFVQTIITWEMDGREFKTRWLDADQTEAAIKATVKMLNIVEINYTDNGC